MIDPAGEPMRRQGAIQFGPFELDLETGELRKQGRLIKLPPKPSQALILLARSHGRLVTRDAMRRELWDSDTHVDFEHGLNFCVREVRTALGDCAKKPRYIETLPRRGYRLIMATRIIDSRTPDPAPHTASCDASQQLEAYQHYEQRPKKPCADGKRVLRESPPGF